MSDCINNYMCWDCDLKDECERYKFMEENARLNENGKLE